MTLKHLLVRILKMKQNNPPKIKIKTKQNKTNKHKEQSGKINSLPVCICTHTHTHAHTPGEVHGCVCIWRLLPAMHDLFDKLDSFQGHSRGSGDTFGKEL